MSESFKAPSSGFSLPIAPPLLRPSLPPFVHCSCTAISAVMARITLAVALLFATATLAQLPVSVPRFRPMHPLEKGVVARLPRDALLAPRPLRVLAPETESAGADSSSASDDFSTTNDLQPSTWLHREWQRMRQQQQQHGFARLSVDEDMIGDLPGICKQLSLQLIPRLQFLRISLASTLRQLSSC